MEIIIEYIGVLVGGYELVNDICLFGLESCIEYIVLVIFFNLWFVFLYELYFGCFISKY